MPSTDFEKAATDVKALTKKPSDDELLQLYGLFKQATVGDNDTEKPGLMDFKGRYKWEKWTQQKGKSQEKAETEYIELVKTLQAKYA